MIKIFTAIATAQLIGLLCDAFPSDQKLILMVFSATVILWSSEALPVGLTAITAPLLLVFLGAFDHTKYIQSFLDPVVFLMIGSFILATAFEKSGLADRIALTVLSQECSSRSYSALLFMLGLISSTISLLVSNTAVTAMMLPVVLTIISHLEGSLSARHRIGLLLMTTWGSSIAVGFLIGTPPNLIAASYAAKADIPIGFLEWMVFGMPIHIVMLVSSWLILFILYGTSTLRIRGVREIALTKKVALGSLSNPEQATLIILLAILAAWATPDIVAILFGAHASLTKFLASILSPSNVALGGAALFLLLPKNLRPFSLGDAIRIDWNTILLFGGGIALGRAAFDSGLANTIGHGLLTETGLHSQLGVTALCTFLAIFLSELASNTAAAAMLIPLAASLASAVQISPLPPLLGAALGSSLGFMLPISTPPNAIVYSSKLVPMREMIRSGLLLDIVGGIVTVSSLRVFLPILGWW